MFFVYKAFIWYQLASQVKPKDKQITLEQYIKNQKIGIKDIEKHRYFYGKNINNYVWYNGRMWRIIKGNNETVLLITDKSQTSINWGEKINFVDSNIYQWLNYEVFYRTITDLTGLKSNYHFELLSENDYLNTGAENSFINNNTIFYLMNNEQGLRYVANGGKVETTKDNKLGLGIRPTITLRSNVIIKNGDGSETSPFIIGYKENLIGKQIKYAYVGDYVKYQGLLWRINSHDNNLKLISDEFINNKQKTLTTTYGDTNNFQDSNVLKKLKDFLIEDPLLTWSYYTDQYGVTNNHSLNFTETKKTKLGIPTIGDLFASGDEEDYFLINPGDTEDVIMVIQKNNVLYAEDINTSLAIKAVIKIPSNLLIISGTGAKHEPYVIK